MLLHVVDYIDAAGPVWVTWQFAMERYCGDLGANVSNRRRPYSNISKRIFAKGMLSHIGIKYGVKDALSLKKWKVGDGPAKETETVLAYCELR